MGVPGFFAELVKRYKHHIIHAENPVVIQELLLDTNCLLHPCCFQILHENPNFKYNASLEKKMLNNICAYIDTLVDLVNPTELLYIAIDGVAPAAKLKQQRMRRFKSVHHERSMNELKVNMGTDFQTVV